MSRAIYPGSFDPVTYGHLDIVERSSRLFDSLVIGILNNPKKDYLFSVEERAHMLKESTKHLLNVEIESFSGLLVDYARIKEAKVIVKGLRAVSDFEYELQMASINKKLSPSVETLFMMTNNKYSYLSSSVVKEVALFNGNVDCLVPPIVSSCIYQKIKDKYGDKYDLYKSEQTRICCDLQDKILEELLLK